MRIVITNNHSMLNAGDHMIMRETLRMLHAAMPGATIDLVFNDPAYARRVLPAYVIHPSPIAWATTPQPDGRLLLGGRWARWSSLLLLVVGALLYRLTRLRAFPTRWPARRALLRALAQADLVLVCGGGNLYSTNAGDGLTGWFGLTLGCGAAALLMGKPLALLPQSIGPLHSREQRWATRLLVRHARLTCVRERKSLAVLRELGCAQRAVCLPDLAFGAGAAAAAEARALLGRLGAAGQGAAMRVGMSVMNWADQYPLFGRQAEYEQALLACIDTITAQGGQVVLFAQCCGPSAMDDDRLVSARVQARAAQPGRVHVMREVAAPEVLQAAYGQMDYFIGTRMHAVILALNAGTPALAIGYLHKTRGVFEALGLRERCLDIDTITAAQLLDAFERLQRDATRGAAEPYLDHARRSKRVLAQLLLGMAG